MMTKRSKTSVGRANCLTLGVNYRSGDTLRGEHTILGGKFPELAGRLWATVLSLARRDWLLHWRFAILQSLHTTALGTELTTLRLAYERGIIGCPKDCPPVHVDSSDRFIARAGKRKRLSHEDNSLSSHCRTFA